MRRLELPEECNYIGVFLTLSCNLSCSYCINHVSGTAKRRTPMQGSDWIRGLNRLPAVAGLPVTLQGGEPSLHPHFIDIINGLDSSLAIDILTNLQFDPYKFCDRVSPGRLDRDAPYAPIRVSYHPETMNLGITLEKAQVLVHSGFRVGIYSILIEKHREEIERAREFCERHGIDFRTKELMGREEGGQLAAYKYPEATGATRLQKCECRTSEVLLSPGGQLHRCHHDLYNDLNPLGSILDEDLAVHDGFRDCVYFGNCNPCDIKIKNNRHQQFGHTAVEIRNIRPHS